MIYRTTGNNKSWQFDNRPMDASLRHKIHGPILPMEGPGFWKSLFRRSA